MFKAQAGTHQAQPQSVSSVNGLPFKAATVENATGNGRFVVVCEHASNHIPVQFGSLGLPESELDRHIAWDPGALGVARALAIDLDAALVFCNVSRLVIDCNRDPSMNDAMPQASEDTPVPGNQAMTAQDRAWRVREVYAPFHRTLADVLAQKRAYGPVTLIGMHSFTPVYRGAVRPWHVGILFDRDESVSAPMLTALRGDSSLVVGENQPYSPGDRVYHTLDRHAQSQGQPSVMVEIRNDLLETDASQLAWGKRLGAIIAAM